MVVKRTRHLWRYAATQRAVSRWVLPAPDSPIRITGAARESVNKWLGHYERRAYLRFQRNSVAVVRLVELRARAGGTQPPRGAVQCGAAAGSGVVGFWDCET